MIEIYLLQQLVGISEYSTLSEAAEHLHITQPTLTRSIRKLERLLSVELFRREKNRIYINDNGRLAVEYAKRILKKRAGNGKCGSGARTPPACDFHSFLCSCAKSHHQDAAGKTISRGTSCTHGYFAL